MRTDDFDYHLPAELIAQTPLPRGESRLLVLGRGSGAIEHRRFSDLPEYLNPGDTLVINDTRVTARRLPAVRSNGLPAEALILRAVGNQECDALVRPGRPLKPGAKIQLLVSENEVIEAEVVSITEDGGRRLRFHTPELRDRALLAGKAPLPPYIKAHLEDEERYQTVYSQAPGSAAAPTAGLHFTRELLAAVEREGVRVARITLHVGVDTFRPVKVDEIAEHEMHGERFRLCPREAETINSTVGRIIAVGTTCARALESSADGFRRVSPAERETRLFIFPGFRFKVVDALLTNFHLPKSTLLMLVSALAGKDNVLNAYREAVRNRYRFFSFGDAMLII